MQFARPRRQLTDGGRRNKGLRPVGAIAAGETNWRKGSNQSPARERESGLEMAGKIRLYAGLVLFTYVTGHLVNHSLGLISFDALAAGLKIHLAVWRSWPGTVLLYGALTVHVALVLWRLYTRRNFKYKRWEAW